MRRLIVVLMLCGACAGPTAPLEVTLKEQPTDILLGKKAEIVATAPLPPVILPAPVGVAFVPVVRTGPVGPAETPEPLGPCPSADPLSVPTLEAGNVINSRPKPATYTYRSDGVFETGGANATATKLPPTQKRTVRNVTNDTYGGFKFDLAVKTGDTETVTTFRVIPPSQVGVPDAPGRDPVLGNDIPQPAGPNPKPPGQPGIYMAGVSGPGSAFAAQGPGMLIAELPLVPGDSFQTSGTDGNTTMKYSSRTRTRDRVDACGTYLEAWKVELTDGQIIDPAGRIQATFTATYFIGTQFGGLLLKDDTEVVGTQAPNVPVKRTISATISEIPVG